MFIAGFVLDSGILLKEYIPIQGIHLSGLNMLKGNPGMTRIVKYLYLLLRGIANKGKTHFSLFL